jgi:NAD(P)-dependent dehydrogenase (short-subunit alcohol dehydrogenase family)
VESASQRPRNSPSLVFMFWLWGEMRSAGRRQWTKFVPQEAKQISLAPNYKAQTAGLERLAAQAPAGRPATAEEIAEAIVFLATDRASFIHGAKLAVDGGRTAI